MKKSLAAACLVLLTHSLPIHAEEAPLPPPVVAVATVLELNNAQVEALLTMIQARDAAIRPLAAKIDEIRAQANAQFEQVLTPEQTAKLQRIRETAAIQEIANAFRAAGLAP